MKTRQKTLYRIFLALFLVKIYFFTNEITAQQARGIYLTATDLEAGRLSYDTKCKIKIHGFSFHTPVEIVCGDQVKHLNKDSVYGYKDKEGFCHRFYNKTIYEILNPTESIILYRVMISGKTKYEDAVYSYYFSQNSSAPVLPLTLKNLEACFSDNIPFSDFIEIHFKADGELTEYDPIHKKFKLNRLFELSKNQK